MPAREEARLTTLLWKAATEAEGPLSQGEIDAILQVQPPASLDQLPRQRHAADTGSPSRVWTDTGDQSWLADLVERHRREQFTLSPVSHLTAMHWSAKPPQISVSPVRDAGRGRHKKGPGA